MYNRFFVFLVTFLVNTASNFSKQQSETPLFGYFKIFGNYEN